MDTALINKLNLAFPNIKFTAGNQFTWSPRKQTIIYKENASPKDLVAAWSLLHEVGHAILQHKTYTSDFNLIIIEVEAWQKAKEISKKFGYDINEDHVQDCLDTYRDWLYQRSTCPKCTACSLQIDKRTYSCINCTTFWFVSPSTLCRPYRKKKKIGQK